MRELTYKISGCGRPKPKILKEWAKENLQGQSIINTKSNKEIIFTGKGIKEFLNQPHDQYYEKNALLINIKNVLKDAKYFGFTEYEGRKSHIFGIKLNGIQNYIIANENIKNEINFYSITDSDKVLIGIKK